MKVTNTGGMRIVELPVSDFRIIMRDKTKTTASSDNYANLGYFANYNEGSEKFTLPVAHVICDWGTTSRWCKHYCTERGKFIGDKFIFDAGKFSGDKQFYGKSISTMIIANGTATVKELKTLDGITCDYAISGVPIMRKGEDVKFTSFVKPQGWTGGELYGTYHVFLGTKSENANVIYVIGWKTSTSNMVLSAEAYNKFKKLGFYNVIKADGGGSYFLKTNGQVQKTSENRRINTVVEFGPTGSGGGGTVTPDPDPVEPEKPDDTGYPVPTRTLVKGRTGNDVKWLQTKLNRAGFKLAVDGSFGPACLYVLKCYQAAMGLEIDGSCGPATRESLKKNNSTVKNPYANPAVAVLPGQTGTNVRWVQFQLNKYGATTVDLDGSYGPACTSAVKAFQKASGLEVDGYCGPATQAVLEKY